MSDEADKKPEEAAEEAPRCGQRLAAARESLSISQAEIAKELHLDEPKVAALERNDFTSLGAPVFAKGHLRKYAELVKVDIDDVIADYHGLTRSDGLPPVVSTRKAPRLSASPTPWIAAVVVILIIAVVGAVYWFLLRDDSVPTQPAATLPEAQADLPPPVEVDEAIEDMLAEPEPEPLPTEPASLPAEPLPAQAEPDEVAAEEPAADGNLSIAVRFSGDCWTEITDGNGRRLFFDLGKQGAMVNLSGPEPMSILFGNADNVELSVNGAPYEIPSAGRRGQTARFTLYATP